MMVSTRSARTVFFVVFALSGGVVLGADPVQSPEADQSGSARTAAVVASVDGVVWIERKEPTRSERATVGFRLRTGDVIRVEESSATNVYFSGGHIVRVPEKSQLQIVMDPATAPANASHTVRMSDQSLSILEKGLWVLSDPRGDILLGAMRGTPSGETIKSYLPLSPREETLTQRRPTFHWIPDSEPVRVVVEEGDRVMWRSAAVPGPTLAYPETAPLLSPRQAHRWWLEAAADGTKLGRPVPFEIPDDVALDALRVFEADLELLASVDDAEAVRQFLRCAFYESIGAWSQMLVAAQRFQGTEMDPQQVFYRRTVSTARKRLGLSQGATDLFLDLVKEPLPD